MGKPILVHPVCPIPRGVGSAPREVKHLSTWWKREQLFIPLVAASEPGTAQTYVLRYMGVVREYRLFTQRKFIKEIFVSGRRLESPTTAGNSPVRENGFQLLDTHLEYFDKWLRRRKQAELCGQG